MKYDAARAGWTSILAVLDRCFLTQDISGPLMTLPSPEAALVLRSSIMNMSLASLFLLALMFLPVWILVSLGHNIRRATTTGLPYVLSPVHELEPWAWVTTPILRWHCSEYLLKERGWPRWARFMIRDWHYEDKGRAHEEYGTTFLVVTPGGIVCYSVDQDVAVSVATQRKAFVKPPGRMSMQYPLFNHLGRGGRLSSLDVSTLPKLMIAQQFLG